MQHVAALVLSSLLALPQDAPGGVPEVPWPGWPAPSQRLEDPPPIVPETWLVATATDDVDELLEAVVRTYLVDPEAAPPRAGAPVDPARPEGVQWAEWNEPSAPPGVLCAYATVAVPEDQVRMARLEGGEVLVVNGEPFAGDPVRRGLTGMPVLLREGWNRLYVLKAPDGFELELWKPRGRLVIGAEAPGWPASDGAVGFFDVEVPVFNASLEPVEDLHFHYRDPVVDPLADAQGGMEWRCGGRMLPLGFETRTAINSLKEPLPASAQAAFVCAEVYEGRDEDRTRTRAFLSGPIEGERDVSPPDGESAAPRTSFLGARFDARWSLDWRQAGQPVHLIYGTHGEEAETAALLALARFDGALVRLNESARVSTWTDDEALEHVDEVLKSSRTFERIVVLYGNERTNAAWEAFPTAAPARTWSLAAGSAGAAHAGWSWNDRKPGGDDPYVLRLFDDGAAGTRLALLLRLLGGLPETR